MLDFSLQAGSKVTHEDVIVPGEHCPAGRDYSLNLLVFCFVFVAVLLFHVDVAFNVLCLSGVDVTCMSVFIIIFVFNLLMFRP